MGNYSEKLRSPMWQKKRLEILSRDNFTCYSCGDTETELHVHHLKYTGEPYEAPNEDLQTLCKHCHSILEFLIKATNKKHTITIKCVKNDDNVAVVANNDVKMLFKIIENELDVYTVIFLDREGFMLKLLNQ